MFRKTIIAFTTVAAVAAAALVPASAGGGGGGGGKHHPHFGFRTSIIVAAPLLRTCGLEYQWVQTRRGLRQILVDTCTGLPY